MPPRKKPKTDAAPDVEPLKPVEMTAAELRRALELKGIKPKSATARPALVRMLQEATTDGGGAAAAVGVLAHPAAVATSEGREHASAS